MQLVMLETNGNQRYIFSSPRLRDNIGASSLLTRLEQWTGEALVSTGAAEAWRASHGLPPAPDADESQWVSRSSGKVIVMVDAGPRRHWGGHAQGARPGPRPGHIRGLH